MEVSEEDERRLEVGGWRERRGEGGQERVKDVGGGERWRRWRGVSTDEKRMGRRSEKVVESCAVTVCHKRRFFRFLFFFLSRSGLSLRQKGEKHGGELSMMNS